MYYEDLSLDQRIVSRPRIVSPADIDLFASVTGATNPLFLSDELARQRGFSGRVAPGMLTLSLGIGLLYGTGLFDHILGFTGLDDLSFHQPVLPGDELRCEALVLEKVEGSRPDRSRVAFDLEVIKTASGEAVLTARAKFVYVRRPA
jgi:acyl dehydratase